MQTKTQGRLVSLDFARVSALLAVVLYHAAAAYSSNTPYWSVHDGSSVFATGIRELVDVFVMPIFFFLAGYFTLLSLRRRGYWSFFKSKFWELGFIWLFVVLIFLPFIWWFTDAKSGVYSGSYLSYWMAWLGSVGEIRLGVLNTTGDSSHMHYWFISLLFSFFIVFIVLHKAISKLSGIFSKTMKPEASSKENVLLTLLVFGLVTSIGYFVSLLLIPDMSWFSVKLFLQFQPSKLFVYIAYFGLGIYGYSRNWFVNGNSLGRLSIWAPIAILSAAGFLVVGQDVFFNPASTPSLSPAYLALFALLRSFFLLSVLIALSSFAMRYFNRPSRLIQTLSDNSYYIYLAHVIIIHVLQETMMLWSQGPAVGKILAVFLIGTAICYTISRWVFKKFPRGSLIVMLILFFILPVLLMR